MYTKQLLTLTHSDYGLGTESPPFIRVRCIE